MWLLPTKNRPHLLQRFCQAHQHTTGGRRTEGRILVSRADYESNQKAYEQVEKPSGWQIDILNAIDLDMGPKLNWAFHAYRNAEWFGLLTDQAVPRTKNWDLKLSEAVVAAAGKWMLTCDDGRQAPRRLGPCVVWSRDMLNAAGWIFPPTLPHLFADDVWEKLGKTLKFWKVDMAVLVEHRHQLDRGGPLDRTHKDTYEGFTEANRRFIDFCVDGELDAVAQRIKAFLHS